MLFGLNLCSCEFLCSFKKKMHQPDIVTWGCQLLEIPSTFHLAPARCPFFSHTRPLPGSAASRTDRRWRARARGLSWKHGGRGGVANTLGLLGRLDENGKSRNNCLRSEALGKTRKTLKVEQKHPLTPPFDCHPLPYRPLVTGAPCFYKSKDARYFSYEWGNNYLAIREARDFEP